MQGCVRVVYHPCATMAALLLPTSLKSHVFDVQCGYEQLRGHHSVPLKFIGQSMLGTDHPSAKPWCGPPQWTPETSVEDDLDTRPLTRAMFEAAVAAVIDLPTLFTRMKEEASLKLYEAILTQTQRWMVNVAQRPKFVQVSTILPSSSSSSLSSSSSS